MWRENKVYIRASYERFGHVPELVSQAEFARRINRSRAYVNKLVKQGKIPLHNRKVDVAEAVRVLEEIKDPRRAKQRAKNDKAKKGKAAPRKAAPKKKGKAETKPQVIPKYAVSLAKKEFWKAESEELRTLELAGTLVRVDEVVRQAYKSGRDTRDSVLEVAPRLAKQLAALKDPHAITQLMLKELRKAVSGHEMKLSEGADKQGI
ncbi:MAG: hypothetical protein COA70_02055 [Planctomycetota bacterium]|nr:MAG: hypothetical protein COA70_02055 [Planctomycetota bacterium]